VLLAVFHAFATLQAITYSNETGGSADVKVRACNCHFFMGFRVCDSWRIGQGTNGATRKETGPEKIRFQG
jgi:hypothetical protein